MLVPIQSGRHRQVHDVVRHRKIGVGDALGQLSERGSACGHGCEREDRRAVDPRQHSELCPGGRTGHRRPRLPSERGYERDQLPTIILLTILVIYVTLVYAPIAAWLVELFPTRIRYSGLSLPYHIGNGWFGGFLPATVFAIVAATGDIYSGLWYPILVACMSLVVGLIFLPETKDVDITKY